jgi:uncharacterized protein YdeI (YjbR/CyaY-like superfamily)
MLVAQRTEPIKPGKRSAAENCMAKKDPRVDVCIENAADFAQPILKHIRKLIHAACPEVEETIKWRFPTFMYKGMLCGMAAFKNHCTFGFWKHELLFGRNGSDKREDEGGMGQFGRLTQLSDLPKDAVLLRYIKEAMRLNDHGVKVPSRAKPKVKKPLVVPAFFRGALNKNTKALAAFDSFSYSHKKEYLEWLTEAKTEETRSRRLATTLEWLAQGKSRNWKYANC